MTIKNSDGGVMALQEWVASNKTKELPKKSPHLPLVDKIFVTLKLPLADFGAIYEKVYKGIGENPSFQPTKKDGKCDVVQLIAVPGSTETVHFKFDLKDHYRPDATFNLNVAKLGPVGMKSLHQVLIPIFPGGWSYVVKHGRVSIIEIAVDLHGVRMHDFHLLPDKVLVTNTYKDGGKLKTITIGKGNQIRIYSKSHEVWSKASKGKGLNVQKGPPVVRVECRLKNVAKSLKDLHQLDSPFTKFKLVSHPPEPPSNASKAAKLYWPLFKDCIAVHGLALALKLLPENQQPIFRKHFTAHAEPWWDPGGIWAHWPEVLKKSGLIDHDGVGA